MEVDARGPAAKRIGPPLWYHCLLLTLSVKLIDKLSHMLVDAICLQQRMLTRTHARCEAYDEQLNHLLLMYGLGFTCFQCCGQCVHRWQQIDIKADRHNAPPHY
jgi:hypothetical protein